MVVRLLVASVLVAGGLPLAGAAAEPAFKLGFEGCPPAIDGQPGEVPTFEVLATLATSGLEGRGADSWNIIVAVTAGAMKAVTLEGIRVPILTDDDGDPATPPVPGELDLLAAEEASVEFVDPSRHVAQITVVLDREGKVALPPEGRFPVARITIETTVPDVPACRGLDLAHVFSLDNGRVRTWVRRLGEEITNRSSEGCYIPFAVCTPEFTLALAPAGKEPPLDGDYLLETTVAPGDHPLELGVFLTSSMSLPEKEGPQGWSLSFEHGPECMAVETITAARLNVQTIFDHDGDPSTPDLDPYDHSLPRSSFLKMEEGFGSFGSRGVVAACVLNNQKKMVLHMNSTDRILRVLYTVPVLEGKTTECSLRFVNGLKGVGKPVDNMITCFGYSFRPQTRGLVLRLTGGEPPYRIGDANADGRVDLSDAIFILENLFLGGPRPSCRKTADLDDNGSPEITDPIFLLNHLFLGGPPPVEPGACRPDKTPDGLTCLSYPPCE
jgi:hypothetical protein